MSQQTFFLYGRLSDIKCRYRFAPFETRIVKIQREESMQLSDAKNNAALVVVFSEVETATHTDHLSIAARAFKKRRLEYNTKKILIRTCVIDQTSVNIRSVRTDILNLIAGKAYFHPIKKITSSYKYTKKCGALKACRS